jgi:hypothetical protein
MSKLIPILFLVFIFSANLFPVYALDKLAFDSTDHYLGGCQLTNKSSWELKEDLNVTTFEVWYSWNANETTLPVKVYKNGEVFADFVATRSQCDPYQKQWCNADYKINKVFPAGSYTTEIPEKRQCLKPGGTGAIRLYVNDEPVLIATPEAKVAEPVKEPVRPAPVVVTPPPTNCSCNQTPIILTAVGASVLSSFIISLLLKKLG